MRAGALSCVALSLLAACEEPPVPCDPAPTLLAVDPLVRVREGGRARIPFPLQPDVEVSIAGLAPGFTARIEEGEQSGAVVVGAPYGITGELPAELIATCDDGHALALPVTFDVRPLVATVLSAPGAPGAPPPRSFAGMAVVGGHLVVAAGTASGAALDDAWALDLATNTWRPLALGDAPFAGPVAAHALPGQDRVLVHGANGGLVFLGLDGQATPIAAAPAPGEVGPGSTSGASLVLHPASGTFLSLCGGSAAGDALHCEVSALSLDATGTQGTWRVAEPTGFSPLGRMHAVVGFDAEAQRVVLFGGLRGDGPGRDAWSLDVTALPDGPVSFARLGKDDDVPIPRAFACGAVDPVGGRFIVVGGTSGSVDDGSANVPVAEVSVLDLGRDDARWRSAPVRDTPSPTVGCSAAYDAVRARLLVGFGHDEGGERSDVWAIHL